MAQITINIPDDLSEQERTDVDLIVGALANYKSHLFEVWSNVDVLDTDDELSDDDTMEIIRLLKTDKYVSTYDSVRDRIEAAIELYKNRG